MKIAIDGFELDGHFTGVGRYLNNLLNGLLNIDPDNSYTLFKRVRNDPFKKKNLKIVTLESSSSHTKWQNSILLKSLNSEKFDIFFSPNHTIPILYKGRSFMTVHDVSWRGVPDDFSLKERISRDLRTRISLKRCDRIFTVSEYSKEETIRFYHTPPDKIIPIHSGIEESFLREPESIINAFKSKFGLKGYITIGFLGSMFKRRHIPELIGAFGILKKKYRIKLLLVGKIFDKKIEKLLDDPEIVHIERISEKEINAFYSSVDLFAYLSEYEGFGFPPLESLKCGTPPLLLRSTSLNEVFNNIAIFIDNPSPEEISDKISEFILDREKYEKRIFKNFDKKANYFSWEKVAGEYFKYFFS